MDKNLTALKPALVWKHFAEIAKIPRPSSHEEKIRAYVIGVAKSLGLECKEDAAHNVYVRKPASKGMENRKGIVLQAHLDMVPQKNNDKKFDFTKDPIEAYIDGEWVTADGTTLGADNGIGVATGMAVLLSKDIPHGPIEVLITATEETGMDGANGIRPNWLKGDILLNLDSETEGELYVGCAGGIDGEIEFTYTPEAVPAGHKAYQLTLKGLKGGHSGMDINLGRGNANKLFFRFLKAVSKELDLRLASVSGGNMRNAIPREAFGVITVPAANADKFLAKVKEYEGIFKAELSAKEPNLSLAAEETAQPKNVMPIKVQNNVINAIKACPNGTMRMIDSMPDTVETSNNLAIVRGGDGKIEVYMLMRSSVETAKTALAQVVQAVFELAEASKIAFVGEYPGWKPNPDSAIRKEMEEVYMKLYGKKPAIMAIHAGLECGILGSSYPNWDMISFGPTISSPHSPDEKVNIESVGKFWEFLKATLAAIPTK